MSFPHSDLPVSGTRERFAAELARLDLRLEIERRRDLANESAEAHEGAIDQGSWDQERDFWFAVDALLSALRVAEQRVAELEKALADEQVIRRDIIDGNAAGAKAFNRRLTELLDVVGAEPHDDPFVRVASLASRSPQSETRDETP